MNLATGPRLDTRSRGLVAIPTRLSLRVVCLHVPESVSTARGRVINSVCLGIGEPGREPELVFAGGQESVVIYTYFDLTPADDGSLNIGGPFLAVNPNHATALSLRWGTRTSAGSFLLFGGTHLRLPPLVTAARPGRRGGIKPGLSLTVSLIDAGGGPRLGIIEANDLDWRLTSGREPACTSSRPETLAEGA